MVNKTRQYVVIHMLGLPKQECSMHDDMCFETPAMCQDCEEIGCQECIAHKKMQLFMFWDHTTFFLFHYYLFSMYVIHDVIK